MKRIVLLGSTGSVGKSVLDIVRKNKEKYKIVGLSAFSNAELLLSQIKEFNPEYFYIEGEFTRQLSFFDECISMPKRVDNLMELASLECDMVVSAIGGIAGLMPALTALKSGRNLAIANKEAIVCGGKFLKQAAKESGAKIIPVDSEHSSVFQCLTGENKESVKRIILTASGGAFRDKTKAEIEKMRAEDALNHPVWSMGKKVTVDSATLFNKSLEIAEASILFDIHVEKVSVVMHPESVIHAIVQYGDNSYKASMYYPDMSLPIEYALSYPERGTDTVLPLDFEKISRLSFYAPDTDRFPCLNVMPEALARGEGAAVAASSADEALVDLYLKGKIGFYDIYDGLIKAVKAFEKHKINTVQDVFDIDKKVRKYIIS